MGRRQLTLGVRCKGSRKPILMLMIVNHNEGRRAESVSKARAVTCRSVNYCITISKAKVFT
ncbi:MAG: hypothetical protein PQJ48_10075 [Sphaerochaetaceae bacterium]|nr:hypothetical protein [Sphaerochaetaceae bacterium]